MVLDALIDVVCVGCTLIVRYLHSFHVLVPFVDFLCVGQSDIIRTHSEKSHICQMRAWPCRQERRGHGPTKKNLSYR